MLTRSCRVNRKYTDDVSRTWCLHAGRCCLGKSNEEVMVGYRRRQFGSRWRHALIVVCFVRRRTSTRKSTGIFRRGNRGSPARPTSWWAENATTRWRAADPTRGLKRGPRRGESKEEMQSRWPSRAKSMDYPPRRIWVFLYKIYRW